jgi:small-conductance mechanosensitive channel
MRTPARLRNAAMSVMATRLTVLLLILVASITSSVRMYAQEPLGATADPDIATAPVELDGVVLFSVRGASALPAPARARLIRDRIEAVAADRTISIDSLRVVDSEGLIKVLAGERIIMGIVEADASLEQLSRAELAALYRQRIQQAIADHRAARSGAALRRASINTLLGTLLLAVGFATVVWLWRRLDALATGRLQAHIHSVGIQSFEVMRGDRIWSVLQAILHGLRTVVLLAGALVFVGYVLAQWPWSRGLSRDIVGFALAPLEVLASGLVANIPRLVFLAVLFYVVRLVLRLFRLFFEAVGSGRVTLKGFDKDWAGPTYKIVRVAIIVFGSIVAYPYVPGSESEAFKGVSLFIGLVFSLGSSSAIANMIAGYMITYRRAFKIGDRVKIGDSVGDVVETRLQVTHLRSVKNEEIVIPNSQILGNDVINFSSLAMTQGLILHTEVGIGYETPWRQVEAMLLTAAERCALPSGAPPRAFVLLKRLGDFAVTYELNMYCSDVKAMGVLYSLMHRHVLDVFNEFGVQIMTPAYESDPAEPKIVPPGNRFAAPTKSLTSESLASAGAGVEVS